MQFDWNRAGFRPTLNQSRLLDHMCTISNANSEDELLILTPFLFSFPLFRRSFSVRLCPFTLCTSISVS